MVKHWIGVGLLSVGVVIGVAAAGLRQEPVMSAQGHLQCRSWTFELSIAGRYVLVACKQ